MNSVGARESPRESDSSRPAKLQPRSGDRMQATAQAVGKNEGKRKSPEGAKENLRHNSAWTVTALPTAYSSASGCKLKSFSPRAFFSAYFFIHASQLLPAAVSRPVNASAAISAYDTETFSLEFFG